MQNCLLQSDLRFRLYNRHLGRHHHQPAMLPKCYNAAKKSANKRSRAVESSSDDDAPPSTKRCRTVEQSARSNTLNVFRRTLDSTIKYLNATTAAQVKAAALNAPRPLPAERFTVDVVQSILESRGYSVALETAIPVWIAGNDEPIFVDAISKFSIYATKLPVTFTDRTKEDAAERLVAMGILGKNPRRPKAAANYGACINGHALVVSAAPASAAASSRAFLRSSIRSCAD